MHKLCMKVPDPPDEDAVYLKMSSFLSTEEKEDKVIALPDISRSLDKALYEACETGNITIIGQCLKTGINEPEDESSPGNNYKKKYYALIDYLLNNLSNDHHNTLFDITKEGLCNEEYEEAFSSLLRISVKKGNSFILQKILTKLKEQGENEIEHWLNREDDNGQTVLMNAIAKSEEDITKNESKSTLCIEILMEYRHCFDIDAKDYNGNTALHYAVQDDWSSGRRFVKILIMNGACINIENKEGVCALDRIPANTIEDILSSCIEEPNGSADERKREDYQLQMDFRIFSHKESLDAKNESEFIRALQESQSHHHLILHPLIITFLHIKWQKLKYLWYLNLVVNMIFFLIIFIYMLYYRNLFLFETIDDKNVNILLLKIVITFMGSMFMMGEILQFKSFKSDYLKSFDNYLKVIILIMTGMMLYIEDVRSQQSIAAWLIVLISVALLLIIEKMHLLELSLYISMFRKVTYNFVKLALLLFWMVLAFAVSFLLLIQGESKDGAKKDINNETYNDNLNISSLLELVSKNGNRFAPTLKEAFLKTLIMSTGEFEFSNLDFSFYPGSRLLFAVFVFSVFLVGMNLLNGIAISDVQVIQKDASNYLVRTQIDYLLNFDDAKPFVNWIRCLYIWKKGQIFEKCYPDKIIGPIHPNKHYYTLWTSCNGHKEFMFHHLNVFAWYGSHPKKIGQCNHCKTVKKLHRCRSCGQAKTNCDECIEKKRIDEHIKKPCKYKHRFMIPHGFVTAAMQLKEEIERKEKNIENDNKLSEIEKILKDIFHSQGNHNMMK